MIGIRTVILGSALSAAALTLAAVAFIEARDAGAPVPAPMPAAPRDAPAPEAPAELSPSQAVAVPAPPVPAAAVDRAPADATFAAPSANACGQKAARYEGDKGFQLFVTRMGRIEVQNPLLPLTPETTQILQVTIGARVATAYGRDLATLRRGGPPATIEAQLGAAAKWEEGLPTLPDLLTIVSDEGQPIARLSFRECAEPPPVTAPAPAAARKETKPPRNAAKPRDPDSHRAEGEAQPAKAAAKPKPAPKVPPGFSLPQGAIAE